MKTNCKRWKVNPPCHCWYEPSAPPQHFSLLRPASDRLRNDIGMTSDDHIFSILPKSSYVIWGKKPGKHLNVHNPNLQTCKNLTSFLLISPFSTIQPSEPPLQGLAWHLLSILSRGWRKQGPWIETANVETSVSTEKKTLDVMMIEYDWLFFVYWHWALF